MMEYIETLAILSDLLSALSKNQVEIFYQSQGNSCFNFLHFLKISALLKHYVFLPEIVDVASSLLIAVCPNVLMSDFLVNYCCLFIGMCECRILVRDLLENLYVCKKLE